MDPLAFICDRLPSGALFIPTRCEFGNDALSTTAPVIHEGFTCDVCKTHPIQGTRWRCFNGCDFDMCDACHSDHANVKVHRRHPFVEYRRTKDSYDDRNGFTFREHDEYEHTIYLLNSVLAVSATRYSKCETGTPMSAGTNTLLTSLLNRDVIRHMQRIQIDGRHFDNDDDYIAYPIGK